MKARKKILLPLALVLILALWCGWEIYRSACCLEVDHYEVHSAKVSAPVRIVQLSDLHNSEFGKGNAQLLEAVAKEKPDLILFTGDLVTGSVKETDVAMKLVDNLVKIAPVYISVGNHEQLHQNNFGSDVTGMLEHRGTKVLEFGWDDVEVNGQSLRIGGISGYCLPEIYLKTGEAKQMECDFLTQFQDTDRCTLLMCHMPVTWITNGSLDYWDVDLVFSGHAHGGQVVLPGLGGVYAPDMGFFPGQLEGLFHSADGEKTLVLSSGLGSSTVIPRFNNPPQILVMDILP